MPDLRRIIAFRNVLIYGCATVDPARIWRVIEENLPPLRAALAELLAAARRLQRTVCALLHRQAGQAQAGDVGSRQ